MRSVYSAMLRGAAALVLTLACATGALASDESRYGTGYVNGVYQSSTDNSSRSTSFSTGWNDPNIYMWGSVSHYGWEQKVSVSFYTSNGNDRWLAAPACSNQSSAWGTAGCSAGTYAYSAETDNGVSEANTGQLWLVRTNFQNHGDADFNFYVTYRRDYLGPAVSYGGAGTGVYYGLGTVVTASASDNPAYNPNGAYGMGGGGIRCAWDSFPANSNPGDSSVNCPINIGDGAHTLFVRAWDGLGNRTDSSNGVYYGDGNAPTCSISASCGSPGTGGWCLANMTATLSCSDAQSGVASTRTCADVSNSCSPATAGTTATLSAESAANYARGNATDNVGNGSGTVSTGPHKIDKTDPVVTLGGSAGTENDGQTQSFTWGASDATSGLSGCAGTVTKGASTLLTISTCGGSHNFDAQGLGSYAINLTATDNAGRQTASSRSVTVTDDDSAAPSVTLSGSTGSENDGQTQSFSWSISDNVGLASCSVTVSGPSGTLLTSAACSGSYNFDAQGLGTFTIGASATDNDGDWSGDALSSSNGRTATVTDDDAAGPAIALAGGAADDGGDNKMTWSATDPSGIGSASAKLYAGASCSGAALQTSAAAAGSFDLNAAAPGTYTLCASATDGDGDWSGDPAAGSNSLTYTFTDDDVTGPSLSCSTAGGQTEANPGTITANASDASGLGSCAATPSWTGIGTACNAAIALPAQDGAYTVAVAATDGDSDRPGDATPGSFTCNVSIANTPPQVTPGSFAVSASVTEGGLSSLTVTVDDPGADDGTLGYTIDWGDGETSAGSIALNSPTVFATTHLYDDDDDCGAGPGSSKTCAVSIAISDGEDSTVLTASTTVNNSAPAATLSAASPIAEGGTSAVAASFTDLGAPDTHGATIDCGGGTLVAGPTLTDGGASGSVTGSCKYGADGTYAVTATVTDDDGGSTAVTATVVVNNVAPTATIEALTASVNENGASSLTFKATDPGSDDAALGYVVSWGDGLTSSGTVSSSGTPATLTHTYLDDDDCGPGPAASKACSVTVTATDSDLATGSAAGTTTANNVAPTASLLTGTATEGVGTTVQATVGDVGSKDTGSGTLHWGDGQTTAVTWGTAASGTRTQTLSHTYADDDDCGPSAASSKTCTVTLTVSDDDSGSGSQSKPETVKNANPVVTASGAATVDEGQSVSGVQAAFTDLGAPDTHAESVNCGGGSLQSSSIADGGSSGSVSADCLYGADGSYALTTTVSDDDSGSGSAARAVTVLNVAPAVDAFAVTGTVTEGGSADVSASASDPGSDDATLDYTIDWGDGSTTGGTVASGGSILESHLYEDDDDCEADDADASETCAVTLTVTDSDDDSDSASGDVEALNADPELDASAYLSSATLTLDEGDTLSVDGPPIDWSDVGVLDEVSGTIDWGDGNSGAATVTGSGTGSGTVSGSHLYADDADCGPTDVCEVTVTVGDDDTGTASVSFEVTVNNVAPSVGADDAAADEREAFDVTAAFSDPGAESDRPYGATLTGASLVAPVAVGDGDVLETAPGEYQVTLSGAVIDDDYDGDNGCVAVSADVSECELTVTVTDKDGDSGTATLIATITNVNPAAESIAADPQPVEEGSPATVTADFSDVSENDAAAGLTYGYDCGGGLDSNAEPGPGTMTGSVDCTYGDDGTYGVSVEGTDKDGGSDAIGTDVEVVNVAPSLDAVELAEATVEGAAGEQTLTASFSDPGWEDTHEVTATWGDGDSGPCGVTEDEGVGVAECSHVWADNDLCGASPSHDDVCTVTVEVCDDDGDCASSSVEIAVENVAPEVVDAAASGAQEGLVATLEVAWTDPAGGLDDPYTIDVDWGDGNADSHEVSAGEYGGDAIDGASFTAQHIYSDDYDGSFGNCVEDSAQVTVCSVTVTVTDVDGDAGSFQTEMVVENAAPEIVTDVELSGDFLEGSPIALHFEAQDLGCLDAHEATVDWGDGDESAATVESANDCGHQANLEEAPIAVIADGGHTYGDNGTYAVCVVLTDKDGATAEACGEAEIGNVDPAIVSASADPNPGEEGSPVTATVEFTDPGWLDGHAETVDCGFAGADLDASGTAEENDAPDATGTATAVCTYGHAGSHTISVEVCDDDGGCDSTTVDVEQTNVAPALSDVAADPQPVDEGSALALSATFSDPSWLDTHTAEVDCGFSGADLDGLELTEENDRPDSAGSIEAVCTYGHAGVYTVTVTVTDDGGDSDVKTLEVEVANVAPALSAIATEPNPVDEGSEVTLSATFADPSWLDTHTSEVDCGFGGADLDANVLVEENDRPDSTGSITAVCVYGHAGTYTATVTVTDDGGDSDVQTVEIEVLNVAPTLSAIAADPQPVDEGSPLTLTASFSDPSWLDTHTASVDCGFSGADLDGLDLTEENARPDSTGDVEAVCTYGHAGTYTVTMTVTDDSGDSDVQTLEVEVSNVPPTAAAIADLTTDEQDVSFSTTFTDPSWLDAHTADVAIECLTPEVCGTAANNGNVYGQAEFDANSATTLTEENVRPDSTGEVTVAAKVPVGVYSVTVTVTDDVGDSDGVSFELTVRDDFAPNAEIAFPDCDAASGLCKIVNVAVPVIGTADDDQVGDGDTPDAPGYPFNSPDLFESYSVDLAEGHGADCGNDALFTINVTGSTTPVTAGTLATLDPDALGLSGEYTLRVHAEERSEQYTHPNDSDDCVCLTVLRAPDIAVASYGSKGNGFGEFNGPVDVAASADGSLLYVADRQNDRVQVLDRTTNEVVTAIDVENKPMGVAADAASGKVYVAEGLAGSVGVYDGAAYQPGAIDNGGHTNGVAVDGAGNVWAVNSQNGILNRYPAGSATADKSIAIGSGAFSAGRPSGIDVTGSGDDALIYVAERNNDAVNVYDVNGTLTCSVTGAPMNKPEGVAVNPEGYIYVGDRNNDRILKFAPCDGVSGPINVAIFGPQVGNGIGDLNKSGGIAAIGTETICFANENGVDNAVICMTYPDATPSGPQALDASGATQTAGSENGNNNNAGTGGTGGGNGKGNGKP